MRTFVAVDLDPKIKASLSELISRLSCKQADVRWAKKQGMHITLKFLGEVPETDIQRITDSLRKACDSRASFLLSFKGSGYFPPKSKLPRVLWAGIEQNQDLAALHNRIEDELGELGFPREKRQFHPHLTLGRVKSNTNIAAVLEVLSDHKETNFGIMPVKRVSLFKSTLKPTGAEYNVLSGVDLT
ncbi:RNA 2',3'-cyclic phosphodiesterase [Acidobacteriota bacterium]